MSVMVEENATGATGDGGQAGPGVEGARQLHSAGAVAETRAVSSASSFPDALNGLCTGHLSGSLNHTQTTSMHMY